MGNKHTDFKAPSGKNHDGETSQSPCTPPPKKNMDKNSFIPHLSTIKQAKLSKAADQLHALVPAQFQFASLLVAPSVAARG